jgi:RNA ligase
MRFVEFKKIPRLSREILVTEKLDGSNGQICIFSLESIKKEFTIIEQMYEWIEQFCLYIHPENPHVEESDKLYLFTASRNRWLSTGKQNDNHAFAYWVQEHGAELVMLGEGRHFGEWMGKGIQRGYGLEEKRFYLFNVSKWVKKNFECTPPLAEKQEYCPNCCEVVPILYEGIFDTIKIDQILNILKVGGSVAVNHYMNPEGIVIFHTASGQYFKKTIENDEKHKGEV